MMTNLMNKRAGWVLVEMMFGSHLYGTNTASSDTDIKGIFVPSRRKAFLNQIPKTIQNHTKIGGGKNSSEDTDTQLFSIQYFIELACQGQTVAIDMLHADEGSLIYSTPWWDTIVSHRDLFYTKNLDAFVGYAKTQAAKYGIRGSRINTIKEVLAYLSKFYPQTRLADVWDNLPMLEHCSIAPNAKTGVLEYEVCGRKVQPSIKVIYAMDIYQQYLKNYGERAELAALNKGIDWKAVSHAVRAALQLKQLYTEGTITFPLIDAALLKQIKAGELDYSGVVAPMLEGLIDEVTELSAKSLFPEKVDREFWDDTIYLIMGVKE